MTIIYGHRGYSKVYPENTMISFKKAYEIGVGGIEFDLQRSKDGILVVAHDEDLKRILDIDGYIKDLRYDELLQYNFSNKEGFNEKIPTLRDVLEFFKDKKIYLNIELKTDVIRYGGIEGEALKMVREFDMEDWVIFSSFNFDSIKKLKSLGSKSKRGYLVGKKFHKIFTGINKKVSLHPSLGIYKYFPFFKSLTKNLDLRVWTVNGREDINRLLDMGVDGIITDDCKLAVELKREREING